METLFGFLIIGLVVWIYFLPAYFAYRRQHANRGAILVLNFFLGWTLLGWVAAAVWAYTANVEQKPADALAAELRDLRGEPGPAYTNDTKACPFCAETIKAAAVVCKHCGRDVPA